MAKKVITVVLALVLTFTLVFGVWACAKPAPAPAPAPAPPPAPKKVHWDVNVWGPPRTTVNPMQDWADDMGLATNGLWDIKVHYGAVLSPPKENLDGLKAGTYEATLIAASYNPGKTPLHTIHTAAFLAPNPIPDEWEWVNSINKHPAMVKEIAQWNGNELFGVATYGYQLMSKKPVKTVDDFKGMRIRALPAMGAPFKEFGASIEMMPGPDIYTALERGMLDAVLWVWPFTFGAYRLYELAPYATLGISAGKAGLSFHVNKDAWNALPKEWQDLATWWAENRAMKSYQKWHALDDAKWLPTFAKSGVQISTFPPEERAKLVEKAEAGWETWVKDMEGKGLPGREILDLALAKKAEIEAKKAEKK